MLGLPWPLDPVIGRVFRGFAYNGRSWVHARGAEWQHVHVFTTDGRYTPSEDLLYVVVECFGPGGGGGWATGDLEGVTITPTAAGGGGSGGYSRKTLPAELVIQGADVAVPIGGIVSAGTGGGTVTASPTSFGGLCVAHAGGNAQAFDGMGVVISAHGLPGAGAAPGTGDIALPGAAGSMWSTANINLLAQHLVAAVPGLGGQLLGGAAWPPTGNSWLFTNANGADGAANSGAGGGGAQVNTGSTAITMFGGRGGSGLCIVTEVCGTENGGGGGGGGITPPTDWPPGVPFKVNVKAKVIRDPNPQPVVEPIK